MSIASEIARITAARNKTRAQAVALGLKTWAIQARKVFTSGMTCDFTTPFILDSSKTYKVRVSVTEDYLQFCEYDNLYDATEDGLRLNAMDENDIGWSNWLYASDLVNHTTWEHIISGVGRNTLNICCYLYNDCTDEYPLTMEVFTLETITETDNLDAVADAFESMPVKNGETITANGTLENGYYRDCTVSTENCNHPLADIEVAVDARNVLVKDVSTGQVLQEALDGDDSISGAYLVNMVTLTDIPDTTALESRVRELESELTNIETELKEL